MSIRYIIIYTLETSYVFLHYVSIMSFKVINKDTPSLSFKYSIAWKDNLSKNINCKLSIWIFCFG